MAETTSIAWCKSSFNPWIGCTKVSDGCTNCYAAVSTPARALKVEWGPGKPRHRTSESNWNLPRRWNKLARDSEFAGRKGFWPVFCASLADVFDNEVDPQWRADLFLLIEATPNLTWLALTKRVGNAQGMVPALWRRGWPRNFWLGASIVNQEEADRDIPKLLAQPAAKRFVSYEPALGSADWESFLKPYCDNGIRPGPHGVGGVMCPRCDGLGGCGGIDWIIVGGESTQGAGKARPFDVAWARSTVQQCQAAGVACFVKQMGSNVLAPRTDALQFAMQGSWTADGPGAPMGIAKPFNRAGADPAEWPADIRIQQFPE